MSLFTFPKGFIGYLGLLIFSTVLLIGEYFSGKFDVFTVNFGIHLTQILSLILIILSSTQLYKIYKQDSHDTEIMGVK